MPTSTKKRVLLPLSDTLLMLTDEAARTLQMSRVSFIRQAIAMRVASFNRIEKPMMRDVFEDERPSQPSADCAHDCSAAQSARHWFPCCALTQARSDRHATTPSLRRCGAKNRAFVVRRQRRTANFLLCLKKRLEGFVQVVAMPDVILLIWIT